MAIQTIISAFKTHDNSRPLTFHFAGDNGVGKTLTAKTIAEAVYQYGNPLNGDFRGLLYFRGEQYQGTELVEEYRKSITRRIVDQLRECPNSLIVFDEVEYLAPATISVVSSFMDDSISTFEFYDGVKCTTNEATFIIISDFGSQGRTNGMTFHDIKTLVERDSKEFWISPKATGVITHVIPFIPLSKETKLKTIEATLKNLKKLEIFAERDMQIEYSSDVAPTIATLSDATYKDENGRGITKYIESDVLPYMVSALTEFEAKNGRVGRLGRKAEKQAVMKVGVRKGKEVFVVELLERAKPKERAEL